MLFKTTGSCEGTYLKPGWEFKESNSHWSASEAFSQKIKANTILCL